MKNSANLLVLGLMAFASVAQAAPHGMLYTRQQNLLNALQNMDASKFSDFSEFSDSVTDATKPPPKPARAPKVLYYGGPVISNAKVYAVIWGPKVDATTQAQIGGFFAATLDSSFMDWLTEYNTNVKAVDGRQGTNQTIGRGTFENVIMITPKNASMNLTDNDIQVELDAQITAGVLPAPDANTLYMTFFPPNLTISLDGGASCASFCAYHEGFTSKTNGNVFYGVMPDLGGACAGGCGSNASQFDDLTAVTAHELIEAVTDPFPTPGDKPAYPQAWNDNQGNEVADLCTEQDTAVTASSGRKYILQQIWDNTTNSCQLGPYRQ
jgi:hypothetical protein